VSDLLRDGVLAVQGRLTEASNATLYCLATDPDAPALTEPGPTESGSTESGSTGPEPGDPGDPNQAEDAAEVEPEGLACVYKPIAGERPLWDFPDGTLAAREVSAYAVSEALGWELVPRTVMREGPYGPGMCQQWIDSVEEAEQFLAVLPARPREHPGWCAIVEVGLADGKTGILAHRDSPGLRRIALFDLVINNADRKGGHVLPGPSGQLYAIDHGVSFHTEDKVRTLFWGFAEREFTAAEQESLRRLRADAALADRLAELLAEEELAAFHARIDQLLTDTRFPGPGNRPRPIPWPPV
jgi:uncharacterized repeat protein (TIGR03843 family)